MNQSFISGTMTRTGLAVDRTYVYWVNLRSNTIGRANLDGTGVNQSFISGASQPSAIAVDGTYIYWTNFNTIGRANLDGTGVNQTFISGVIESGGIAVDGTYIYWTNSSSGTIGRANLDGTGVNQSFISGLTFPLGIAVCQVPVQIEVEPFVPKDPIALNSPLPVPVVVLGSSTVDVTQIDMSTLRFGPEGATPLFIQNLTVDGQKDLLALFAVQDTGLAVGDTEACLQERSAARLSEVATTLS